MDVGFRKKNGFKFKKKVALLNHGKSKNKGTYESNITSEIQQNVHHILKSVGIPILAADVFDDKFDARTGGDNLGNVENTELLNYMKSWNAFESSWLTSLRWTVLKQLSDLVDRWVQERTYKKFQSTTDVSSFGGFVVPFGSFALGVHNPGSDIDTLIVAPRHVTREDFFTNFVMVLQNHPKVTQLHTVEDAFVPIVKLTYRGIELDLLFAQTALPILPSLFSLEQDWILKNVDPKSVRSMHGVRVTEEIVDLVPNKKDFIFTLKTIKFWSKRRGIYGNTFGFPGGVSWALMVAKVCQLCRYREESRINMFFLIFFFWSWPSPVTLRPLYEKHPYLDMPSWNPVVNGRDRNHVMPVITPSYPQINSTFNVSTTTLNIIKYEMLRGLTITKLGEGGKKAVEALFRFSDFYHRYKYYLILTLKAKSNAELREWVGVLSSKMRHLLLSFQDNPQVALAHIHPYTQAPSTEKSQHEYGNKWIIGMRFATSENEAMTSISNDLHNFIFMVNRQAMSSDKHKPGKQITFQIVHRESLKDHISEKELEKCDQNLPKEEFEAFNCFNELCPKDGILKRPLSKMASRIIDLKEEFDVLMQRNQDFNLEKLRAEANQDDDW